MRRNILGVLVGCAAAAILSGCVTTRTYMVNKERVDQAVPGQSAEAPAKTRKMFVLEVVQKDKAAQAVDAAVPASTKTGTEGDFTLPQGASAAPAGSAELSAAVPQTYVVQANDTLQKIAKKVCGSYSKWTKIYEANRDVIKDPNFLKPGLILKIPEITAEGAAAQPASVN